MTRPAPKFAIRADDGSWSPCGAKLNKQLAAALRDMAGTPNSITVRDEHGDPHVLSFPAGIVVELALRAMDARLRPGGCYRERADEIYVMLATRYYEMAVRELRRVFQLGAKKPWLLDDDKGPTSGPGQPPP